MRRWYCFLCCWKRCIYQPNTIIIGHATNWYLQSELIFNLNKTKAILFDISKNLSKYSNTQDYVLLPRYRDQFVTFQDWKFLWHLKNPITDWDYLKNSILAYTTYSGIDVSGYGAAKYWLLQDYSLTKNLFLVTVEQ